MVGFRQRGGFVLEASGGGDTLGSGYVTTAPTDFVTTSNLITTDIIISGASKAASCVLTVPSGHGLAANDGIYIQDISGMTQLNGNWYTVTGVTTTTATINVDSTAFTTYTSGGVAHKDFPCNITAITQAANAQVTATNHGRKVGETVKFVGVSGMTQINNLTGVVQSVVDVNNFTVNINSTGFSAHSGATGYALLGSSDGWAMYKGGSAIESGSEGIVIVPFASNSLMELVYFTHQDFSSGITNVVLDAWIEDVTNLTYAELHLSSRTAGSNTFVNYNATSQSFRWNKGANNSWRHGLVNGINRVKALLSEFVTNGTPVQTNGRFIGLRMQQATGVSAIRINRIDKNQTDRAIYILEGDDMGDKHYTDFKPLLEGKGLKMTLGLETGSLDGTSKLTTAQFLALLAAGHGITGQCHSATLQYDTASTSLGLSARDVQQQIDTLASLGYNGTFKTWTLNYFNGGTVGAVNAKINKLLFGHGIKRITGFTNSPGGLNGLQSHQSRNIDACKVNSLSAMTKYATVNVTGITNANPGVVTAVAHPFANGDSITLYDVAGMTNVNHVQYTVTVVDADHFSIGVNTTAYGVYTSGGKASTNHYYMNEQLAAYGGLCHYLYHDGINQAAFTLMVDHLIALGAECMTAEAYNAGLDFDEAA